MSSPSSLLFNTPTSTKPHKPTKKSKQRKNPQRGMGVERLERLRLQEAEKTTKQHHHRLPLFNTNINPFNLNTHPPPLPDHLQCYFGLPVNMYLSGNSGAEVGFNVQHHHNPHISNVKHFSSLPNMHHLPSHLSFKKKMYEDQSLGHKSRRTNFSPPNPPSIINLDNFNTNNTPGSFTSCTPTTNPPHLNHNTTKGKDVVAVHRKGNTYRGGGSVLMEYEFFPITKTTKTNYANFTNTASNEWEFLGSSQSKLPVGEASSCVTNISNSIDLSLRLSF